jgi:hypothetical protein
MSWIPSPFKSATAMIDEAEANAVEPAEAPEQILIDPFIGEKIHHRFEVQTERPDGDQMTKSLDASGGSPECQWITRLHVQVQQFGVPSFKQAMGSPGIHVCKQLDLFRAVVQKTFRNTGNEIPSPARRYE